jgi:hypothetical protein
LSGSTIQKKKKKYVTYDAAVIKRASQELVNVPFKKDELNDISKRETIAAGLLIMGIFTQINTGELIDLIYRNISFNEFF